MSRYPLYGYPHVDDPHDFDPDPECCSPAEIATWKMACATYGKANHEPNKGGFSEYNEKGDLVLHVARTSWGIGTNMIPMCDDCEALDVKDLITCHECGREFCETCWPAHDKNTECV